MLALLGEDDLLILTADHGCDPTWQGTDHTREYVPVLAFFGAGLKAGSLGRRKSFADIGQSIASHFCLNLRPMANLSFRQISIYFDLAADICRQ